MWPQCRITRHIIKEHMLLLIHPGHEVRKLCNNGGVQSEHAHVDHPAPRQLTLILKEYGGQGNSIRHRQEFYPDNCGIPTGGRLHIFPLDCVILTEEKRLEPPSEVFRVAHSCSEYHDLIEK